MTLLCKWRWWFLVLIHSNEIFVFWSLEKSPKDIREEFFFEDLLLRWSCNRDNCHLNRRTKIMVNNCSLRYKLWRFVKRVVVENEREIHYDVEHNCMALTENYILISLFAANERRWRRWKKIVSLYNFFVLDNEDVTSKTEKARKMLCDYGHSIAKRKTLLFSRETRENNNLFSILMKAILSVMNYSLFTTRET